MKYVVEVLNIPVRYNGKTYNKGEEFEMEAKHLNETLVKNIGEVDETPKTIDEMTIAELKSYAKEKDIDLGEAKKQKEILEAIQAAEQEDAPPED